MLRGIRKASSNWLGKAVMGVVMGLLIISFAVWGIGDIFRGFGRSSLAQIGGTEITIEQFRQFYNERLQQLGRRLGRPLTPDQVRALGIDRQLLSQLITEAVLNERVRRLGLGLPDQEIARRITEDPNFRGPLGQFDRSRFEQVIRGAGYTEQRFVTEQRHVLLRRQIAEALGGEVSVPNTAIDAMSRFEGEERAIEYMVLDPAKAGEVTPPPPEALAQYFEERKNLFRAPEFRKVLTLTVSPTEAARWLTVSDADARAFYQQQKARFETSERRQIQQIVFPNPADARAAADRLKGGITFDALAAERGLKPADFDLGLLSKSDIQDNAVAEAAFALKAGETSEPLEGRFGPVLVHVVRVEPGSQRSFDEVAPQIKREIALQRGRTEMLALHDKIEDELAAGQNLTEIAQKLGLSVNVLEAVDRSGRDPAGAPVAGLPTGIDVVASAFSSDVGVENEPLQLPGGGYVWYEVAGITPSRERTFEEMKDRVEAQWRDEQLAERLQAKANELADRINRGAPFAEVAAAENLKTETASGLKRNKSSEALSAGLIESVFRIGKGTTSTGPGQNAADRVVFRVTDVSVPKFEPGSAEAKRIEEALARAYSDDLMTQYLTRLQSDIGVTINQSALRQIVGGETN